MSGINGFDIEPKSRLALAALSLESATASTLYAVDLTTGAATLPAGVANGTIGGGERLRSLSWFANPTLSALALTQDARLLMFAPATPGMPAVDKPVSGLMSGETLLGLDVRPLDGALYALGSAGNLYTLDRSSAVAKLVTPLAAASGDDNPFVELEPCDHGVDFNPVADLLRVVNSSAANLRVAPSSRGMIGLGDTFSDGWLNPGTPAIVAAVSSAPHRGERRAQIVSSRTRPKFARCERALSTSAAPRCERTVLLTCELRAKR